MSKYPSRLENGKIILTSPDTLLAIRHTRSKSEVEVLTERLLLLEEKVKLLEDKLLNFSFCDKKAFTYETQVSILNSEKKENRSNISIFKKIIEDTNKIRN